MLLPFLSGCPDPANSFKLCSVDEGIPSEDRVVYDCWIKPELGLNDQYGLR